MSTAAFYWLCTYALRGLLFLAARWEVAGKENLPATGPVVLVANHLNLADPPLLGCAVPRRVTFMAKQELFDIPVFGWLVRWYGAFPVRRFEADLKSLRRAQDVLKRGGVLGIFPEGTRSRGQGLRSGHPGTAVIALRSGAPVVPVAITGTEVVTVPHIFWRIFRKPRIRMVIGEPFHLPSDGKLTTEHVERCTETIMQRIATLLPDQYRGAYRDSAGAGAPPDGEAVAAGKG